MTFWILAGLIGLLAALFIAWPLLRERAALRNYGFALVLLVPLAALMLYQVVGTPEGIGVKGTPGQVAKPAAHPGGQSGMDMDSMIASLEGRLQENPADLEGWLLLGRSYKAMQRYDQAESALVRAIQLAPNDPLVMVELAEAKMFTSGSPNVSPEVRGMLEQVLEIDPNQQKALWLLGIAAAQDGNDEQALNLWSRLAAQLETGSPILASLEQQMSQVRQRSGLAAEQPEAVVEASVAAAQGASEPDTDQPAPGGGWGGLKVAVEAPADLGALPPGAALFVIVRNPAMPGPPLGAARMAAPTFPTVAFISDANSMMQNNPISAAGEVEIVARLSMTGSPGAQPGDLESEPVRVELAGTDKVALQLAPK
jgi:cytochrome c-type biogenesis protein CcmH